MAAGFVESTRFTTSQYSNGNGVLLAFMLVPGSGSPVGSSPDFTSGPIIPNSIFPVIFDGNMYTNGSFNDYLGRFAVPPIDSIMGFETLEGQSHMPFFVGDNFDFASRPITGNYEYQISLLDANGNGYQIAASFQVVPEPSSIATLGIGLVALFVVGKCRRVRAHD